MVLPSSTSQQAHGGLGDPTTSSGNGGPLRGRRWPLSHRAGGANKPSPPPGSPSDLGSSSPPPGPLSHTSSSPSRCLPSDTSLPQLLARRDLRVLTPALPRTGAGSPPTPRPGSGQQQALDGRLQNGGQRRPGGCTPRSGPGPLRRADACPGRACQTPAASVPGGVVSSSETLQSYPRGLLKATEKPGECDGGGSPSNPQRRLSPPATVGRAKVTVTLNTQLE